MCCHSFWQTRIRNHFNTRYMTPLWVYFLPLSCSTITARFKRVKVCLYMWICVCRGVCVCRWERVLRFAVEETLKWFVPFGALRHLGEHSLNYARSSVIVPLSRLRSAPLPSLHSVHALLRVLALCVSQRCVICPLRMLIWRQTARNRSDSWSDSPSVTVCEKGTMTLPAESRAHTKMCVFYVIFLGECRDFFGYSMKFALLSL